MSFVRARGLLRALTLWVGFTGCSEPRGPDRTGTEAPRQAASAPSRPEPAPAPNAPGPATESAPAPSERLVLVAGGDVNLGRQVGLRILRDSSFDPFLGIRSLLARADLAFANLESPLSDQNGETEDRSRLAFVGPPRGAELIARAPFHVVSVANNHAWDYGRSGFFDTLAALEGARVAYTGGSREAGQQYRPTVLEVKGWSVALFAVTHLWNPGDFEHHEAREHVAWADAARLVEEVRRARARHQLVLVSYHGGREYVETPAQEPLDFARALMEAGADAVLAHHPHVPQGVGWFEHRPIFYSLGNLVFGRHRLHPWTARGYLARLSFGRDRGIEVAACPYQIEQGLPQLTARGGAEEARIRRYLRRASAFASPEGTVPGVLDEQGCFSLAPG